MSTNRPPSIRSTVSAAPSTRRPPPALRGSSARPARAKPHVTLVFAHGDAAMPAAPREQSLRRAICGASASEEALSRQLDRDTAGQHMGLRSRRSSTATIQSMRTDYSSHPLASPALREEDDDDHHYPREESSVAGPSRLAGCGSATSTFAGNATPPAAAGDLGGGIASRSSMQQPPPLVPPTRPHDPHFFLQPSPISLDGGSSSSNAGAATPQRRLNPKTSSSWLRWTSPAPTFPKKDKGKARELDATSATAESSPTLAPVVPPPNVNDITGVEPPSSSVDPSIFGVPAPPRTERTATTHTRRGAAAKVAEEPAAAATHTHENTVSSMLPAQSSTTAAGVGGQDTSASRTTRAPSTASGTSATTPMATQPHDVPEPTTPMLKPIEPTPTPTPSRGWRAYLWGAGGEDTTTTTPAPDVKSAAIETAAEPEVAADSVEKTSPTNGDVGHVDAKVEEHAVSNGSATSNGTAAPPATNAVAKLVPAKEQVPSASALAKDGTTTPKAPDPSTPATALHSPSPSATTMASADAPVADDAVPSDEDKDKAVVLAAPAPAPAPGWGSYLASFVYPSQPQPPQLQQPKAESPEATDSLDMNIGGHAIAMVCASVPEPTPLATAPVSAPPPPTVPPPPPSAQLVPPPNPQSAAEPDSVAASADSSQGQSQIKLGASTSSTAGWLSYLAFRASQKKITDSTASHNSDVRKSGEIGREEVMDFSADPDFPAESPASAPTVLKDAKAKPVAPAAASAKGAKDATTTPAVAAASTNRKPASTDGKDTRSQPLTTVSTLDRKPSQSLSHKRSQNLAIEPVRRGSITSSIRSASSAPNVPLSPRSAAALSQAKANSALPNPPQPSSKQPNFIVPSFSTTFDRPPRSLVPRAAEGVTATALRAFSYVYGTKDDDETRGKKEGRDVGADLPRRIGLHSGHDDDGWRNVKRVVVVGVHGWFPAKMLNTVIGEPTGTSQKFANMMGEAVKQFFRDKDVDESEIRLTLIPLEGEGVIDDRVDKLYKAYLANPAWINDLRRADAILFAAHSQGCVVTTHLISRLIAQGHIRTPHNREAVARCEWAFGPIAIVPSEDSKKGRRLAAALGGAEGGRQKVAMLAMCGVHLGPLYSISTSSVIGPYLQWFENAAARELFEFQDTNSAVAQAYHRSLAFILDNEVRTLLIASLNDQVVPIYGASFSNAEHPLLLRALFVDGASYSASDFMTNLLCFAFMLRNAGIDDQRLVEHLSEATAGSLTGVGHSTPYEELACYSLCVQYLFHAGPAAQPLPPLQIDPFQARDARNDFELPWIMRALVDAPEVKDLFPDELKDLRESILAWKPLTKALREMKKRLEPMAGRQPRIRQLGGRNNSSSSLSSMGSAPEPPSLVPKAKVPSKLR